VCQGMEDDQSTIPGATHCRPGSDRTAAPAPWQHG
jgi:hypothetical protein